MMLLGPLVACAALFAPAPADSAPRYKFKEGDTVNYVVTEKSAMEIDAGAGAQKVEMLMVIDLGWKVAKVGKDGKFTVTQTMQRVRLRGTVAGQKLKYDSKAAKPDD